MQQQPPQNRRLLVVEDDRLLAEELRASLRAAGFDAEVVSLAAGLTPEFLARIAPGLILLDASAGGLRAETVRQVVLGMRTRLGARLLLMGAPGPALAARARELGADGAVDKAQLLRDPRLALGAGTAPAAAPAPAPVPPPLPKRAPPPPEIVSMIEEELARLTPGPGEGEPSFHVVVDLFSENNFFLAKTTAGRLVGIFVATDLPPPVGSIVRLTVVLLGGYRIETRAEVTWTRERSHFSSRLPPGAGMRMLDLSDEDKRRIRHFLTQRAPYSYTGT